MSPPAESSPSTSANVRPASPSASRAASAWSWMAVLGATSPRSDSATPAIAATRSAFIVQHRIRPPPRRKRHPSRLVLLLRVVEVLRFGESLLGAAVVVTVLRDVFQSVVTPRPVGGRWRLGSTPIMGLWRMWRWAAFRLRSPQRRETMLGSFGPLAVVGSLVAWVVAL